MRRRGAYTAVKDGMGDCEPPIDYTAAGLYLVGLQTIVATVSCAAMSVACCWLIPEKAISAVRTLALTSATGVLMMRKPLRLGRVRGVLTVFNALRPCVPLYVLVLVIEQLIHTCVPLDDGASSGILLRVVFHVCVMFMVLAGFIRAHRPCSETDLPFLVTVVCLLVMALLPPPATPLSGPLCEPSSLFTAGERILRALIFASLYSVHVYTAAPSQNAMNELSICIMRSASAAIWVLGCHVVLLVLAVLQAVVALFARFGNEEYAAVETASESGQEVYAGYEPSQDTRIEVIKDTDSDSEGKAVDPRTLATLTGAQPLRGPDRAGALSFTFQSVGTAHVNSI